MQAQGFLTMPQIWTWERPRRDLLLKAGPCEALASKPGGSRENHWMFSVSVKPRLVGIEREGPMVGSGPHLILLFTPFSHFLDEAVITTGVGVSCNPCLA